MHFTTLKTYSPAEIVSLVEDALLVKGSSGFRAALRDKTLYMLFQKTSTRTALSFAVGVNELGGHYFSQRWEDSNFCVGEIADEVRYVSTSAQIFMARLKHNADLESLAAHSPIPVINGCCDKYHPCQALADILTVREIFGRFDVKLLYIGVRNNIHNSLLATLPRIGGDLYTITPIVNESSVDEPLRSLAADTGRLHEIDPDPATLRDLVQDMDVVYVDTWIDMEFFNRPEYQAEKKHRIDLMTPYQVNEELMRGSGALVMHDMPIHPGFEITRGVVEANIETILRQADNRKHAQKAVLLKLLEDDEIQRLFRQCRT